MLAAELAGKNKESNWTESLLLLLFVEMTVCDITWYCNMYSRCYATIVSGQRLGKYVPAATVTHATGETGCCLRGPRRGDKKEYWGNQFCWALRGRLTRDGAIVELTVESWVVHGRLWQEDLSAWSWRMSTVRNRCQRTAEAIAGWKRLSRCCGDLWSVEISDRVVSGCSSEWSINPVTNPYPVCSHTTLHVTISYIPLLILFLVPAMT
jgi:hypothetical protein